MSGKEFESLRDHWLNVKYPEQHHQCISILSDKLSNISALHGKHPIKKCGHAQHVSIPWRRYASSKSNVTLLEIHTFVQVQRIHELLPFRGFPGSKRNTIAESLILQTTSMVSGTERTLYMSRILKANTMMDIFPVLMFVKIIKHCLPVSMDIGLCKHEVISLKCKSGLGIKKFKRFQTTFSNCSNLTTEFRSFRSFCVPLQRTEKSTHSQVRELTLSA